MHEKRAIESNKPIERMYGQVWTGRFVFRVCKKHERNNSMAASCLPVRKLKKLRVL
jgi:hypothetical protein